MRKLQVVKIFIYEGGMFGKNSNLNKLLSRINPNDIDEIKITKEHAYIFYYTDLKKCSQCESLIPKSQEIFDEDMGCPNKCEYPHCEFCGELLIYEECPNGCNKMIEIGEVKEEDIIIPSSPCDNCGHTIFINGEVYCTKLDRNMNNITFCSCYQKKLTTREKGFKI